MLSSANPANPVAVVRQPVFNRKMQPMGYLLRFAGQTSISPAASDKAVARLLVDAFTSAESGGLTEQLPVFLELRSALLLSGLLMSLPPRHVVFCLTDTPQLSDDDCKVLAQYKRHKFRLAVTADEQLDKRHPICRYADFIRFDATMDSPAFQSITQHMKRLLPHARLLAFSVNDQPRLHLCRQLHMDGVHGNFLCRPQLIKGRQLNYSQAVGLQLAAELQSVDITPARVADLLKQAPQLSYRLLRLINSATYDLTRTIESLEEAVIYLGLDVICHWVSLMVLADASNKPKTLILTTLIRAKMSELLSPGKGRKTASSAFLTGMFSTLDAMLDIEIATALEKLPLSDSITAALLNGEGPFGGLIQAVTAYEQGRFSDARSLVDLPDYQLFKAYGEAVLWAKSVCSQLFE